MKRVLRAAVRTAYLGLALMFVTPLAGLLKLFQPDVVRPYWPVLVLVPIPVGAIVLFASLAVATVANDRLMRSGSAVSR